MFKVALGEFGATASPSISKAGLPSGLLTGMDKYALGAPTSPTTPSIPKPLAPPSMPKPPQPAQPPQPVQPPKPSFNIPSWGNVAQQGRDFITRGMNHVTNFANTYSLPPNLGQAYQWRNTLENQQLQPWNKEKYEAAVNLRDYVEKNKGNALVARYANDPAIKQQFSQLDSPLVRYGMPMLHSATSNPAVFAGLMGLPGIKNVMQTGLGIAGVPGLAYLYSMAKGNTGNWSALTAGLRDPSQRVQGRNAYQEAANMFNGNNAQTAKPAHAIKRRVDIIDRYLNISKF